MTSTVASFVCRIWLLRTFGGPLTGQSLFMAAESATASANANGAATTSHAAATSADRRGIRFSEADIIASPLVLDATEHSAAIAWLEQVGEVRVSDVGDAGTGDIVHISEVAALDVGAEPFLCIPARFQA